MPLNPDSSINFEANDTLPVITDEPGTSRRGFIIGALATFVAGYAAGNHEIFEDAVGSLGSIFEQEEEKRNDILVDPDKFVAFVNNYQGLTQELASKEDKPIPYEVFLAVGMHESDSATSELATSANNLHGIVAKDGWAGKVYPKQTEEEVASSKIPALQAEFPDLKILLDYGDSRSRVSYTRPFRQYDQPQDSFRDFAEKLYFTNSNGSYRYADVVEYIKTGGRDPYKVASLMADDDQQNEARWATGREWLTGVQNYITVIQGITGIKSAGAKPPQEAQNETLPDPKETIDVKEIDFSKLNEARDVALIETMKEGFRSANLENYRQFEQNGITQVAEEMRRMLNDDEYYAKKYRGNITPTYFVIHLWANGVDINDTKDPNKIPKGSSHKATLTDAINSWKNTGSGSSCGYLLSDEPTGDLWQVTKDKFGGSNHVGNGIQDKGKDTHPGANNTNAIGIETQADTIYDVSALQFKLLIYWASKMALDSGIVKQGMDREEVNKIVDATVIGHGKSNGLEFGYKYSRPFIEALQQFLYVAVRA